MTTFTRTWDAAYEALPADPDDAKAGAARIRDLKTDIQERLEVDHSAAGDADDGAHKKVTLIEQGSDPTTATNHGFLYTKDSGGITEVYYKDSAGTVTKITSNGTVIGQLPVGSVYIAVVSTNPGTLLGYGTWTAFATGRMLIGLNPANTLFDTVEETGGSADSINVSHTHSVTDPGHVHSDPNYTGVGTYPVHGGSSGSPSTAVNTGSATTGISVDSSGSSGTNANYPPFIAVYMWKMTA